MVATKRPPASADEDVFEDLDTWTPEPVATLTVGKKVWPIYHARDITGLDRFQRILDLDADRKLSATARAVLQVQILSGLHAEDPVIPEKVLKRLAYEQLAAVLEPALAGRALAAADAPTGG